MNVIVVGCGRVGSQLAKLLSTNGHNVAIIDSNANAFGALGSNFNGVRVVGLGFDEDTLLEAGIEDCDVFTAVTNLDNTNLMAAEVARKIFGVKQVALRLHNPTRESTYLKLGIDYVCGTSLVAEALMEKALAGHSHHLNSFDDELEIIDFVLADEHDGIKVSVLERGSEMRVCGVSRENHTTVPDSDEILRAGDVILASVMIDALPRFDKYMKG